MGLKEKGSLRGGGPACRECVWAAHFNAHPPLSVASSSGSRSPRAFGPGRGTWPSAWPPPPSPGWRSSPVRPVQTTNTTVQHELPTLVHGALRTLKTHTLESQSGAQSVFVHARGSSSSALLHLAQISVFSVNITTAPTGLAAEEVEKSRSSNSNLTTPPGVTTADELPETKEAVANTSPATSKAKLVLQVPVMSSPTPAIWVKRTHPVSVHND